MTAERGGPVVAPTAVGDGYALVARGEVVAGTWCVETRQGEREGLERRPFLMWVQANIING